MKTLLTGLVLLAAVYVQAQEIRSNTPSPVRPRVNADLEFSIPSGEYGDKFSMGFGGSGGLDIPVTRALYATGAAGVMSFYESGSKDNSDTRTYIPMKAAAKYYFNRMIYGHMEIGTSLGIQQGAGTAFILAPGAGMSYPVSERGAINFGVRYESWT